MGQARMLTVDNETGSNDVATTVDSTGLRGARQGERSSPVSELLRVPLSAHDQALTTSGTCSSELSSS